MLRAFPEDICESGRRREVHEPVAVNRASAAAGFRQVPTSGVDPIVVAVGVGVGPARIALHDNDGPVSSLFAHAGDQMQCDNRRSRSPARTLCRRRPAGVPPDGSARPALDAGQLRRCGTARHWMVPRRLLVVSALLVVVLGCRSLINRFAYVDIDILSTTCVALSRPWRSETPALQVIPAAALKDGGTISDHSPTTDHAHTKLTATSTPAMPRPSSAAPRKSIRDRNRRVDSSVVSRISSPKTAVVAIAKNQKMPRKPKLSRHQPVGSLLFALRCARRTGLRIRRSPRLRRRATAGSRHRRGTRYGGR